MTRKINYLEELIKINLRDKANNLSIDNVIIENISSIKRDDVCYFTCNCSEKYKKKIRAIIKTTGLFCKKCSANKGTEKRKKTCMKILGVTHPSKSIEIKKKKIETCIKNYGVKNPSQNKEIQNKKKETCIKRYGKEYAMQNEEIHNKNKETCLKNNGFKYPSQNEDIMKKVKQTCIRKYGVECSIQNEDIMKKVKQTCIRKYGVEHFSQNKEIFEKQQKSRFRKKSYIFKTKQKILCQGYESRTLIDLEKNYNYLYEYYIFWNNYSFWYEHNSKKHRYYPDIPFLKNNLIIEVKSNYTFYIQIYINLKKALSVLEKGINFEFWIYNKKTLEFITDYKQLKNKFELMKQLKC